MCNDKNLSIALLVLFASVLTACGGGGGGGGGSNGAQTTSNTVGGTISGLNGSVVLRNNGGDNLTLSANGAFTFATALNSNSAYAVTVLTQPVSQGCTVNNGSGTLSGTDNDNVVVGCAITNGSAPAAPSALVATALSESSISLTWTDNSSNETGFKVERATSSTGPFTFITTAPVNATTFSDAGRTASTSYFYRVRAINSISESVNTAVATARTNAPSSTAPATPSALTVTAVSASSISLAWADNSANESGFKIERATSVGGPFSLISTTAANVVSFSDAGLTAATTYFYRIRASNSIGDSSNTLVASAKTNAAVATPPSAPSSLSATAASASSITLSWVDSSANETGFKVERAASAGGTFSLIATTAANIVSYSDAGLAASTTYFYRVRATNSAGDSANTSVASATTSAAASGTTTVTLLPTLDNLVMYNSQLPATQTTSFPGSELAVGCNWNYTISAISGNFVQDVVCGRSLVKFDVSSLAGKTIDSASLKLTTKYVGVGFFPRTWNISALATAWTGTVTWDNVDTLSYYSNTPINLNVPTLVDTAFNINILNIVQFWANGSALNNGIKFESNDYSFPNATSLDAFAFYSRETNFGPKLMVTYH